MWLAVLVGLAAALVSALLAGGARSASQASGLIAFTRSDGIYAMRPDGSGIRFLRRTGEETSVSWSPDGRKLAFSTLRHALSSSKGSLWVVNADGTNPVRLAEASWLSRPTWSPNGRRIAIAASVTRGVPSGIWIVNTDGSNLREFTPPGLPEVAVVDWSPTGDRFAVAPVGWFLGNGIYVMRTNGSSLRNLTPEQTSGSGEPDWSPDGRQIAYMHTVTFQTDTGHIGPENSEIWVMNASGTSQVRLTKNRLYDGLPSWSPDGQRIVFLREVEATGGTTEIFVMNSDGTGVRRLTHNRVSEGSPAWQPFQRSVSKPFSGR